MISTVFLFAALSVGGVLPGQVTAYTEETEPFRNPGQGWSVVPRNWDKATNCVNVGLVYDRISWTELEPEEGKYDFSVIDRQLDFASERGVPYHFRVRCASRVSNRESDTPDWVYDKGCRFFRFKHSRPWWIGKSGKREPAGEHRCPHFEDPVFLEAHAKFMKALAARYDGDPRIFAIDIGSYGHFGEWHMAAFGVPRQTLEADEASRRKIADMYLDNFRKTRLVFMTDDETTLAYALGKDPLRPRVGLRRDGVGLPGRRDRWVGSKHYRNVPNMGEVWRTQPLCFEWGGIAKNIYERKPTTPAGRYAASDMPGNLDWIRSAHGVTINSSPFAPWTVRPDDRETLEAIRRCDLYCGARLVPVSSSFSRNGAEVSVDLRFKNKGTSRIYLPYVLQLVARDPSGVELGAVPFAADPGSWLPGDHRVSETVTLPSASMEGARLSLRLKHAPGVLPDFRFAARELNAARELQLASGNGDVSKMASFPACTNFPSAVPTRILTPGEGRVMHHFFDKSPISPDGRHVALLRIPYEDKRAEPGDPADVILVDLQTGKERFLAKTYAWEHQIGACVMWGKSDSELYFNDMRPGEWKPFLVRLDPVTGERREYPGGAFCISPDGTQAAGYNLLTVRRMNFYGYGAAVPEAAMPVNGAEPEDDGLFVTDLRTGERRLLKSIAAFFRETMTDEQRKELSDGRTYGFQVKWSPDGEWLLFVAVQALNFEASGSGKARWRRMVFSCRRDGSEAHLVLPWREWARGGHHLNFHPDSRRVTMNLLGDDRRLRIKAFDVFGSEPVLFCGDILGSGHPSVSPDGRYVITDSYIGEPVAGKDGTVPIRLIDLEAMKETELLRVRTITGERYRNGALRCDPHPAWSRDGKSVVMNAMVGGTRRVVLLDMSSLSAGSAAVRKEPRLFLMPENLKALRERCAPGGDLADVLAGWTRDVKKAVGKELPPEPGWLPKEKDAWRRMFAESFRTIRPPTAMMQRCALVYALGGDPEIGAEAKRRVLYYFGWNPKGPSNTVANDEAAMSIMRNGVRAYAWTYALYTREQRCSIESCIVERSRQIYKLLLKARYHENQQSSHLGRQIGFLAEACVALMDAYPEMRPWFDYVMKIYRNSYPMWGTEDGGWSQGPHYWSAYMEYGLDSLVAVRIGTGIDVFKERKFFRNTPWYFEYQCPWLSPMSPFGDGWQCMEQQTRVNRSFAVLLHDPELLWLADRRGKRPVSVRDLVLDPKMAGLSPRRPDNIPQARCFRGEGLVMSHSDILDPTNNVAFYFRSSPYGALSHGHADQNSFAISGYGEPLAIATGYYDYYGSPHHFEWMRQTRAKCAITFDGGKGQPVLPESKGRIVGFRADGVDVAFTGDASKAYGGALTQARRDVVRVGAEVFVVRDTLSAPEAHSFEFNLHALDRMQVNEAACKVETVRPNAVLETTFLAPKDVSFSQTEGFDPPPKRSRSISCPMPDQWHLTAAAPAAKETVFVTVLAVRRSGAKSPVAGAKLLNGGSGVELTLADGSVRTAIFP